VTLSRFYHYSNFIVLASGNTQEHGPSGPRVTILNRSEQCHTSLNMNFTERIRAVPELMTKVGQLLGEYTGAEQ